LRRSVLSIIFLFLFANPVLASKDPIQETLDGIIKELSSLHGDLGPEWIIDESNKNVLASLTNMIHGSYYSMLLAFRYRASLHAIISLYKLLNLEYALLVQKNFFFSPSAYGLYALLSVLSITLFTTWMFY
jgi:hypothetical protein